MSKVNGSTVMGEADGGGGRSVEPGVGGVLHRPRRRVGFGRGGGGVMQLNLTAMIDVVFQLLVYFVVTASFVADEGVLSARAPGVSGEPMGGDLPRRPLVVELVDVPPAGVGVRVLPGDVRPGGFVELGGVMRGLVWDPGRGLDGPYKADHPVEIRSRGGVRWQHVVGAFNAAVGAGFVDVRFAEPTVVGRSVLPGGGR